MKNYKYILFDLDGTLTEPAEGITNSVAYALDKAGLPYGSKESLKKYIGPPLHESFAEDYGLSLEQGLQMVDYYREYYTVKGLFENRLFDGIPELLSHLKDKGKTLIVATSKPEVYSIKILENFGILKYFDFVSGATLDSSRVKKADVIAHALDSLKISDTSEMIMVGDRHHDIEGAAHHGIDSLGVLFGYGSREELCGAGATYIAETVEDIKKFII